MRATTTIIIIAIPETVMDLWTESTVAMPKIITIIIPLETIITKEIITVIIIVPVTITIILIIIICRTTLQTRITTIAQIIIEWARILAN